MPDWAFYKRGKDIGPKHIITDHNEEERSAINHVWPTCTCLFCLFHLLQAVWKWLFDKENHIEKHDRPIIISLIKDIAYAKDEETMNNSHNDMVNGAIVSKYPNFINYFRKNIWSCKEVWCVAYRKPLPVHGNRAQNYIESQFLVLKDEIAHRIWRIVLKDEIAHRIKSYNIFRQVIGIPMGTNCAPLLADLFLYSYENEFLDNMIRSGHRRLARSFNLCYRYIDDLIVFNNKKFLDYLKEIYPSQLTVEKANKSDHLADYLDLTFIIDSGGKLSTRLYDKRDDFDFHIVNFPFLSSNIPSGPSYGVYISQLIRYARCCSHYDDFRYRHKCLVDRLLSQGYKALRLEKSFKKFYGRYQDLIEKYRRSVNAMVSDSFPGQFLFNM